MLIVGLTGGIGSGKTTVSKMLEEEGAYLIDADEIARELVHPCTAAWHELIRAFGKEILEEDGSIRRKKLAAKVFSDPSQRNRLNEILHPRIKKEMKQRAKEVGEEHPEAIVVIDAALLVELGEYQEMDKVVVVTSQETQQIERVREREGASEEEARRILSSQMRLEEKLKVADFIIRNEGSLEETRSRVKEVFQELRKIALEKREEGRSSQEKF